MRAANQSWTGCKCGSSRRLDRLRAGIVGILTAEEQISDEPTGDVEDPDYNQLFLQLKVKNRGFGI